METNEKDSISFIFGVQNENGMFITLLPLHDCEILILLYYVEISPRENLPISPPVLNSEKFQWRTQGGAQGARAPPSALAQQPVH